MKFYSNVLFLLMFVLAQPVWGGTTACQRRIALLNRRIEWLYHINRELKYALKQTKPTACPRLSSPTYGDVSFDGCSVGDTATVTCDRGYELTGSAVRYCTSTGWNGTTADCVPVTCSPELPDPTDGSVSIPNGYEFEAEAVYQCNSGYELNGNSHRYCLRHGSWSGTAPTCKQIDTPVQCPPLNAPVNGTVNRNGSQSVGTTATYTCDSGMVDGNSVRYCLVDGTWSGAEPTCAAGCSPDELIDPEGGSVTKPTGTEVNAAAIYTCISGYELNGNSHRYCLSDGSWSGTAPTCKQIVKCPPLDAPVNGTVNRDGSQAVGTTAIYTCDSGIVDGNSVRYCLVDGTWSGAEPTCAAGCSPDELIDPEGGSVTKPTGTEVNAAAIYTCISGYELNGNSHRYCLSDGSWSGTAPTCKQIVKCPPLNAPVDGTVNRNGSQSVGTTATYTCDSGLVDGNSVRYCLIDGTWSGQEPTCAAGCSPAELQDPVGGSVTTPTGTDFNAVAIYYCSSGYELNGNSQRYCLCDGSWSGTAPTCEHIVKCPSLVAPAAGTVIPIGSQAVGTTATYTCDFRLVDGDLSRHCLADGTWSGSVPTCATGCSPGALVSPEGGSVMIQDGDGTSFMAEAIFICNSDYELSENSYSRFCLSDGSWSGTDPTCDPIVKCPALTDPEGGEVDLEGPQVVGTMATYTCPYVLADGNEFRFCLVGGTWSGMEPTCIIPECDPGFTPYEDSCYRLFRDPKSWGDAMMFCEENGWYLVEIEDAAENTFVKTLMADDVEEVWTGGTDAATEMEFLWEHSGDAFGYTEWSAGQPDDHRTGEDCVHIMKPNPRNLRKWNDAKCTTEDAFMCEMARRF